MEIQLLDKHGLSLRRIAAELGCAVNTLGYKATQAGIKTRFTIAADLMLALTTAHTQNNLKAGRIGQSRHIACSSSTRSATCP